MWCHKESGLLTARLHLPLEEEVGVTSEEIDGKTPNRPGWRRAAYYIETDGSRQNENRAEGDR